LLHIAREALSNISRHAQAASASVALASEDHELRLEIEDDGRGFDPASPAIEGHFGLANMSDRAAALGGSLAIDSRRPGGTRIIVRIPTPPEDVRP
jgi:signal transduction histidine kinase